MTITLVIWLKYNNHIDQPIHLPVRVSEQLNDNTNSNHNALTIDKTTSYSNNFTITRALDTDVYLF